MLVNNAGIQRVGLIGQLPYEDWAAVIGTHLTGMFLCCSQALPRMTGQGSGGSIVSIASTAGFVGLPGRGPYCAAKAGIMGLTRALSLEGAAVDVRVNAVAPGYTRTEMLQEGLDNGSQREDWMLERVPLKRLAHARRDRAGGAIPRERRRRLHHRPDDRRGRRLDDPGHLGRARVAPRDLARPYRLAIPAPA